MFLFVRSENWEQIDRLKLDLIVCQNDVAKENANEKENTRARQ